MKTTTQLKVQSDPLLKGLHPYHDSRFIVTSDMEIDIVDHGDGKQEWRCETGSIIAMMRDCQHQAEYARLFAAAPELLEACKLAIKMLEYMQKKDLVGFSTIEEAIRKAEGNS